MQSSVRDIVRHVLSNPLAVNAAKIERQKKHQAGSKFLFLLYNLKCCRAYRHRQRLRMEKSSACINISSAVRRTEEKDSLRQHTYVVHEALHPVNGWPAFSCKPTCSPDEAVPRSCTMFALWQCSGTDMAIRKCQKQRKMAEPRDVISTNVSASLWTRRALPANKQT